MHYTLVYYPKTLDTDELKNFRSRYDPLFHVVPPHVTLIFPVPGNEVPKQDLVTHITDVLKDQQPFKLRMKGLMRSWDHWLFLLLKEGNSNIIQLHDQLYTGVLAPYLRADIKYIPHIAIGLFVKGRYVVTDPKEVQPDDELFSRAIKEADALNLDYTDTVDAMHLVTVNDTMTKHIETLTIQLNSMRT